MPEIVLFVVRAILFEFFADEFGAVVENEVAFAGMVQKHSPAFREQGDHSIREFCFCAVYVNNIFIKVYIVPLDGKCFGTSATGVKAEKIKIFEPFAGDGLKEVGEFFGSQSGTGLSDVLRFDEKVCDVVGNEAEAEGASERTVVKVKDVDAGSAVFDGVNRALNCDDVEVIEPGAFDAFRDM